MKQFFSGAVFGVFLVGLFILAIPANYRYHGYSQGYADGDRSRTMLAKTMQEVKEIYRGPPDGEISAAELYSKVRLFCWVMTMPKNVRSKAVTVWNTWGRRCNKVVFMTTEATNLVPAVVLPVGEGRAHLTAKTMQAFNYTYQHYRNEYDWFLKADDDTFVVVENLRYFLAKLSPKSSSYYGYHFNTSVNQGYHSGGAGYVLSRTALKRLIKNGVNKGRCKSGGDVEDVDIGQCLELVGVKTGDSRDHLGRERFHPLSMWHHLAGDYPDWYYGYAYHGVWQGAACCSDLSITFHYVSPATMYIMDYIIHHLRAYGVQQSKSIDLNGPPPPRAQMRNSSIKVLG